MFRYIPTRLWGFSGHVQTIIHSVIGRVKCPWPMGERIFLTLSDGTTLTYDMYQPLDTNFPGKAKVWVVNNHNAEIGCCPECSNLCCNG